MWSLAAFGVTAVCFVVGAAGMLFDPSVREEWGGLLYLVLMALPPMFVAPVGILLGLFGLWLTHGHSRASRIGLALNVAATLAWLGWRFG